MSIERIKIISSITDESKEVERQLQTKLLIRKFELVETNPDLVIAIGGDGTLLGSIIQEQYSNKPLYVGINTGTVGFLQEVETKEIERFLELLENKQYKTEKLFLVASTIYTPMRKIQTYGLNDIVIYPAREIGRTVRINISIDGEPLEYFCGDELIFSTATGSTAYNASAYGNIIYNPNNAQVLQMMLCHPSIAHPYKVVYNGLTFLNNERITVTPPERSNKLEIDSDGKTVYSGDVVKLDVAIGKRFIRRMKISDISYVSRLRSKFLES